MKITAILFVDAIEPCLPFWVDRLGMKKVAEVPEGDRLAFVMLSHGAAELMIQTRASADKDVPELAGQNIGSSVIYVEIDDFPQLLTQVAGLEVLMPVRDAFYGMREIVVREPGGNAVCFAARIAA